MTGSYESFHEIVNNIRKVTPNFGVFDDKASLNFSERGGRPMLDNMQAIVPTSYESCSTGSLCLSAVPNILYAVPRAT